MAAHRPPRPARPGPKTDATVSQLFKKPVTDWYREWKASRGAAQHATSTDQRQPARGESVGDPAE